MRIANEEIDLVKFGEKRRVKPNPNSDTAKIIQWFKDNPNLTKEKARAKAREWIKVEKMSMKLGSVHNVVNQSYDLFLEGEKLNLHEKIKKLLGSMSKEKCQKITEEDLKKDPEFSMYNLDVIRSYLRKYRKNGK